MRLLTAGADARGVAPGPAAIGGVTVAGWGAALPHRRVTNHDLARYLDTSDEWIVERSGIRERRWAGPGESTGPLSVAAARGALARAGVRPDQLDVVVVATATPDSPMPSTASQVAAALGTTAGAFDVNAACAGFVYAMTVASGLVAARVARTALVVGADTMTAVVDPDDRATAVLFGDGAGALVLTSAWAADESRGGATRHRDDADAGAHTDPAVAAGLVATDLVGDPGGVDLLVVPAGGSARPATAETVAAGEHHLRMDGREVFRRAVRAVEASIGRTLDRLGNTSAASIPLALAEAADAGTVTDGDLVLMCGFGAGLTVGTALWRWGTPTAITMETA